MVKNLSGGKRAKAASRKLTDVAPSATLRKAEEGELYAVVTKNWGDGLVGVDCADGVARKCRIRKKFTGRRQRDNRVMIGSAVLVGMREYATDKETCDLLEVYAPGDLERLKKTDKIWRSLIKEESTELESDIVFDEDEINVDEI
jgi:initiation factor 1A